MKKPKSGLQRYPTLQFKPRSYEQEVNRSQAWDSLWVEDLSTLPDFFNENAEVSGFAPPKQMTWKGLDAIKAVRCNPVPTKIQRVTSPNSYYLKHFKEIQPIVSNKSFTIKRVGTEIPIPIAADFS